MMSERAARRLASLQQPRWRLADRRHARVASDTPASPQQRRHVRAGATAASASISSSIHRGGPRLCRPLPPTARQFHAATNHRGLSGERTGRRWRADREQFRTNAAVRTWLPKNAIPAGPKAGWWWRKNPSSSGLLGGDAPEHECGECSHSRAMQQQPGSEPVGVTRWLRWSDGRQGRLSQR